MKAANPSFLFGCDPELFVKDASGKVVSADGLIPGSKEEPYKVEGGMVQVDGMAAEFGIDPANNFEDFNNRITLVMKQLKAMLPKGYQFHIVPHVVFDKDVYQNAPDEAKALGCDPDFNAWTMEPNTPPDPMLFDRERTASGHLHIGFTDKADVNSKQHRMNCRDMVRQLDWYLGAWSAAYASGALNTSSDTFNKTNEAEAERRNMYGQAGSHRIKPYGVEYRVLSNFWLTSKELRIQVWNRMQQAITDMSRNYMPQRFPPEYNKMLQESVNKGVVASSLMMDASYPIKNYKSSRYYD